MNTGTSQRLQAGVPDIDTSIVKPLCDSKLPSQNSLTVSKESSKTQRAAGDRAYHLLRKKTKLDRAAS